MTNRTTCTPCSDYGSLCPLCQEERAKLNVTQEAFDARRDERGLALLRASSGFTAIMCDEFGAFKAGAAHVMKMLESEEMVEKCAASMAEALAKTYPEWADERVTNFDRVSCKAALATIRQKLEEI